MADTRTRATRAATDKRQPQILSKAAQLFQRKGYHATSMDEVATALKLNKATIYHHFPGGKSDLLYGITVAAMQDLMTRMQEIDNAGSAEERLRGALRAMIDVQLERPDETVVYHEELRWRAELLPPDKHKEIRDLEAEFRGKVVAIVADGVRSREFRKSDPELTAVTLINLASSSYRTVRSVKSLDAEGLTEHYAEMVLGGLRQP